MKGINASPGIAIGKVFLLKKEKLEVSNKKISKDEVEAQVKKLNDAIEESKKDLDRLREKTIKELGEEEAQIFTAHAMLLDDVEYMGAVRNKIKDELVNAGQALAETTKFFFDIFSAMDDEYMKARSADVKDVGDRVLRKVLGIKSADLSDLDPNTVIVAEDLTPSDTAQMDKAHVVGFATNVGGRTSHTAIMARSLEIPAVLGLGNITEEVKDTYNIIIDGIDGDVIINPSKEDIDKYNAKKEAYQKEQEELAKLIDLPSETKDGHKVEIVSNIGTPNDIEGANKYGAEGIGLYRTEFLYMNASEMPDEETQFEAYKTVLEGMDNKPVIIRTLDIGGDKKLDYLPLEEEMNPFLGFRAIRLCLKNEEMFKTQLRAILRAGAFGNAHIMFPMISNIKEVRKAKALVEECKAELKAQGKEYDENIKIGIMVEIPSAAVTADIIAKEVDFFSIGTNDLCQYTLAVDRMNQNISYLYDPFNPAILRLVKMVIDASHINNNFTGMCGEMAGDPKAVLLLLGLGLDEFSMSAQSMLQAKKIIRNTEYSKAKELAEKALKAESSDEVKELIDQYINA